MISNNSMTRVEKEDLTCEKLGRPTAKNTLNLPQKEKTPTRKSPFSRTHEMEMIVPTDVNIPTHESAHDPSTNEEDQSTSLDLFEEQCNKAQLKKKGHNIPLTTPEWDRNS